MGGLLPDWSYNRGGISKPSDTAHHWNKASAYYKMPIDGNLWLEDLLSSSYPPSIAFKAAQLQDKKRRCSFYVPSGIGSCWKKKILQGGKIFQVVS